MTRSQIISYSKTSKQYYCQKCIVQNLPFSSISTSKFNALIDNSDLSQIVTNHNNICSADKVSCDLCLECNPECFSCPNSISIDPTRVCETCLICNYALDTNDLNKLFVDFTSQFHSSISALHINSRSLQLHIEEYRSQVLDNRHCNFDIIGISETKLNDASELSEIQIDGYSFEHTNSNLSFGGVGLYISQRNVFVRKTDLEFRLIVVKFVI